MYIYKIIIFIHAVTDTCGLQVARGQDNIKVI